LLDSILAVLARQELALGELIELAVAEQHALVTSDFAAIQDVSGRMLAVSQAIDELDGEREELVHQLDAGQTLESLVPLADTLGRPGVREARERLLAKAGELRSAQEANARLVLNAVKLRERWYSHLAGMSSPTYGAEGRQEFQQGREIVSRSA
jgi:hypothetical protein